MGGWNAKAREIKDMICIQSGGKRRQEGTKRKHKVKIIDTGVEAVTVPGSGEDDDETHRKKVSEDDDDKDEDKDDWGKDKNKRVRRTV